MTVDDGLRGRLQEYAETVVPQSLPSFEGVAARRRATRRRQAVGGGVGALVVVVVVALVVSLVGSAGSRRNGAVASTLQQRLVGTTWSLEHWTVDGGPATAPGDLIPNASTPTAVHVPTVTFSKDRITADDTCNTHFAQLAWSDDGFTPSELGSTVVGCLSAENAIGEMYGKLLAGKVRAVTTDGSLTLSANGVVATLVGAVGPSPAPSAAPTAIDETPLPSLVNSTWRLLSIDEGAGVWKPKPTGNVEAAPAFSFGADAWTGNDGINDENGILLWGPRTSGGQVVLPLAGPISAVGPPPGWDSHVRDWLDGDFTKNASLALIKGTTLALYSTSGAVATFERAVSSRALPAEGWQNLSINDTTWRGLAPSAVGLSLHLTDGRFTVKDGCHTVDGTWSVTNSSITFVGSLRPGCQSLVPLVDAFATGYSRGVAFTITGTNLSFGGLTFSALPAHLDFPGVATSTAPPNPSGTVTVGASAASAAEVLVGHVFTLDSAALGGAAISVDSLPSTFAAFSADRATVDDGCNFDGGQATYSGPTIRVTGQLMQVGCGPGDVQQKLDDALMALFRSDIAVSSDAGHVVLSGGGATLKLTAITPLVGKALPDGALRQALVGLTWRLVSWSSPQETWHAGLTATARAVFSASSVTLTTGCESEKSGVGYYDGSSALVIGDSGSGVACAQSAQGAAVGDPSAFLGFFRGVVRVSALTADSLTLTARDTTLTFSAAPSSISSTTNPPSASSTSAH